MYRSNSTSGTILSTAFILMSLSYSSSVFSADLFDDLLESAIDNISKEVQATKTTVNKAPTKSNVSQAKRKRPNEEHHDGVSYKDWSTSIATFKMQGKWTTICSLSTGALGNKGINIEIPWGSIGPTTMPEVVYFETVQANQSTIFKHKQEVEWRISSKRDNYSFQTHAFAGIDSSGNRYADSKILNNLDAKKSLQLLRAFAKGNTLALSDRYSGVELHTASLSGFSAAYLKAADWCAFSADSVLKVAPSSTYVQVVENDPIPTPQLDKDLLETYQGWEASVQAYSSDDGDLVTNCSIRTGGNGSDAIQIYASKRDVLPPDAPLTVVFQEATARGLTTRLKENDRISWIIDSRDNRDTYKSDDTRTGHNDGIAFAENSIQGNNAFLYSLAHGDEINLRYANGSQNLYSSSLKGFRDAYRRMSQWCGFSANSALD